MLAHLDKCRHGLCSRGQRSCVGLTPLRNARPNGRMSLVLDALGSQQQAEWEEEQYQQQQQQQPYTRTRMRQRARTWDDESTPNTGIVVLTDLSRISGAAACVAADFRTNVVTRIVASTPADVDKAVATVRLATIMVNNHLQQQQEYAVPQLMAFQPVEVAGDLVAPPHMPEGAIALYSSLLPADEPVLQEALHRRQQLLAEGSPGTSSSSSSSQAGEPSSDPYVPPHANCVFVAPGSDVARSGYRIVDALKDEGWVELQCIGRRDRSLPVAIKALQRARKVMYGRDKLDAAALLLDDEQTDQQQQQGRPPFSLLLITSSKNRPTDLHELPGF